MDKEKVLEVIKTKQGKIALVFFVLSVLSLVVCVMGNASVGSGVAGFFVFLVISAIFYVKGEKALENPAPVVGASTNTPEKPKFKPTKEVGKLFAVDDVNKEWRIPKDKKNKTVYKYSDLLDYELIEDGNSVTSGSLGRAVAGGLVFGGLGAVMGGMTGKQKATCNNLQIKITVKDINNPAVYITILSFEVKKDSDIYKEAIKQAQEILSILQIMKTENA